MKWINPSVVLILALWASPLHSMETQRQPAAQASAWLDALSVDGYLSGGVVVNFANPYNKINFGHLETDRANWPQFNQAILTIKRPVDPNAAGIDLGFHLQGLLGTDARYTQILGQTEYLIHNRTQFSIIEAQALAHLPILTKGGVDLKIGQFVAYNGVEALTSKDNAFYTRSLSSNFGPFVDAGAMSITHVTDWLDIYAGIVTGVDTWIGWPGDNNNSPSIHAGVGLTLLDGDLTILAVTHSGPENPDMKDPLLVGWPDGVVGGIPAACACNPNHTWRYFNDLMATWNATENLTFSTDVSYFREDGWNPISVTGLSIDALNALANRFGFNPSLIPQRPRGVEAYGIAQYATYKVNDVIKLGARVEFWRDAQNFFAAAYPGYFDSVNEQHGFPTPALIAQPLGQGTSYLALTAGATISPKIAESLYFSKLIFRPEIRFDIAVNNAAPFFGPNGPRRSQTLFAMDVIAPFSIK